MAHLLCYISYTTFSQILEVLWEYHRLFVSRNSPTTNILNTIPHVCRSVWPSREAKHLFGTASERSANDCETHIFCHNGVHTFNEVILQRSSCQHNSSPGFDAIQGLGNCCSIVPQDMTFITDDQFWSCHRGKEGLS